MKKRNRPVVNNTPTYSIGDSFDDAVWSLETIAFENPPVGGNAKRFFGTGFLFKREGIFRGKIKTKYFLVSNKHVLVEDSPSILVLHLPPQGNHPASRYQLFPSLNSSKKKAGKYKDFLQDVVYPDDATDLAVVDVTEKIKELQENLAYREFTFKTINPRNIPMSFDLPKGTPMEYLGYPDRSAHPRLRKGSIGLNPQETNSNNIALDDVSVAQGASGSPAFTFVGNSSHPKLLGIVYGTQSTQIVEGHSQFDQGHAVKSTILTELTNEILRSQGYKSKAINKFYF